MSEQEMQGSGVVTESTNVVDLAARRKMAEPAEPFLTNAERRELRDLLAYMRTQRPILDQAMTRCTILRRLSEET